MPVMLVGLTVCFFIHFMFCFNL